MTNNDSTSGNSISTNSGDFDILADRLDCGDGVPALVADREPHETRPFPSESDRRPHVTARIFAVGVTVIGQLLIALSVLAGGNPAVGAMAAVTLLFCGFVVVLTEIVNNHP